MIEAGYLIARLCRAVPDVNLTHEATGCYQVIRLVAKLAHHEVFIKVFGSHDFHVSLSAYMPNTSDHIRGACKQFVAILVPVDRANSLLLGVLVFREDVWDLYLLELAAIVLFL